VRLSASSSAARATPPVFLLLCYLGVVLFAPAPFTGDFTELKHVRRRQGRRLAHVPAKWVPLRRQEQRPFPSEPRAVAIQFDQNGCRCLQYRLPGHGTPAECRTVLKKGGVLCFTAPVVVGRLTRSRAGLRPSYHGNPADVRDDYLIWTEFWTYVLQTGFAATTIFALRHPVAHAVSSVC
jgi:hypothetical protein